MACRHASYAAEPEQHIWRQRRILRSPPNAPIDQRLAHWRVRASGLVIGFTATNAKSPTPRSGDRAAREEWACSRTNGYTEPGRTTYEEVLFCGEYTNGAALGLECYLPQP